MKNYVQPGDNLTLTAPYDLSSGDGALVGAIFGVAAGDALTGKEFDSVTRGVFALDKVTANAFAEGAAAFWDNAAKLVTSTAAGNTRIGVATAAAASGAGTANVRLNGSF